MPEPFFQRLQRVKAEGMPLAGSSSNTQEPAASLWLPRNGVVLIQGRCRAAGSTCRRFLILRLHLPQCCAPWAAGPRVREGPAGRRSGSLRGTSGVKSPQAGNKPRPDSHPPAFLQPDLEAASPVRDAADARLSALAASPRLRSSVTAATVTGSPRQGTQFSYTLGERESQMPVLNSLFKTHLLGDCDCVLQCCPGWSSCTSDFNKSPHLNLVKCWNYECEPPRPACFTFLWK
ncbi:coiled-coil domain-containing protein 126 isoform X1 [Trachypithecus francoisi]|uniref:coiled-coil domain-containing protein 126 isoform X1 n=1 Tax=Trachypithecus francoisi TaxID=54180 RepID=UPI00141B7340|nr:coiled-coil domain-containing protein 126 isoform X1 [Trachypithecus francoisi]